MRRRSLRALAALFVVVAVALSGEVAAARIQGEHSPQLPSPGTAEQTPWIGRDRFGDVVYFLYQFPFQVTRYDLAAGSWLPTIELTAVPRAFSVQADGIYITYSSGTARLALDGSSEQPLPFAWGNGVDLEVDGDLLFVFRDGKIQSSRLSTGTQLQVADFSYWTPQRVVLARGAKQFFGATAGLSPADHLRVTYTVDGAMSRYESPYHGDYPATVPIAVDSAGQRVVDEAGIVFANDLLYRSGTGGPLQDVALLPNETWVLRASSLSRLDANLHELATVPLAVPAFALEARNDEAFLFSAGGNVQRIAMSGLATPPPPAPPGPRTSYTPKSVELSDAGTIHLFSAEQRALHRFSVAQWRYLDSVPLTGTPLFAALDRAHDDLYVTADGGRLAVVRSGSAEESFLAYTPITASGLGATDVGAMVADYTGAWTSHRYVDRITGFETDWVDWNYQSRQFEWQPSQRRLWFFRDGISPNDLHWEGVSSDGHVTAEGESPYHGSVMTVTPIRVHPNGTYVVLGSGQVFDSVNVTLLGDLETTLVDATWSGNALVTLHAAGTGGTRVQRWTPSFTTGASALVVGTPLRVFGIGSNVVVVTQHNGRVRITRLSSALGGANVMADARWTTAAVVPGDVAPITVEFANDGAVSRGVTFSVSFNVPSGGESWSCELDGQPATCASGALQGHVTLAPGSIFRASGLVRAPADLTGEFIATAFVSPDEPDDLAADNIATDALPIEPVILRDGFE